MVATQHSAHCPRVQSMPRMGQGTRETAVAPRRVLVCHANHKLCDLLRDTRTPELVTLLAPITLLGDPSLRLAQERVRCGESGDVLEALAAQRVGERREAAAFGVGPTAPAATALRLQDAVFREARRDALVWVPLPPAGDHRDQDLKPHRRSSEGRSMTPSCPP